MLLGEQLGLYRNNVSEYIQRPYIIDDVAKKLIAPLKK